MGRGRRRAWLLIALQLSITTLAMTSPAHAQDHRGRWFIGLGIEAADDRLVLRTARRTSRPDAEQTFGAGIRITAERQLHTRFSAELAAHAQQNIRVDLTAFELAAAVRYWIYAGPRSIFYLRPTVSFALASVRAPQAGLGFGFSIGYRRIQNRLMERFVELTYRVRVFPDVNPSFAESTFPAYGYHPEDAVTLFASFLGVTGGIGFGPLQRR